MNSKLCQLAVYLHLVVLAVAQQSSEACEAWAKVNGKPAGWVETVGEHGQRQCTRQRTLCLKKEVIDAKTGESKCCDEENLTWINKEAGTGFCCAVGHIWTGDKEALNGGCCPIGYEMINRRCKRVVAAAVSSSSSASASSATVSSRSCH